MNALFWHIGIVVRDIDEAKDELARALGLEWTETVDATAGEWTYRGALSRQGPPYLELLQGSPGSPWDALEGSRLDHIALWVDDVSESQRHLESEGMPVALDGRAVGLPMMNYHAAPRSGLRLETVDASHKETLRATFGLDNIG